MTRELFIHIICRNKRPGRLIFRSNKKHSKSHRFCVLPPLKTHPPEAIGFVYSPLWKLTHQKPSVLCTPPFEKSPIKAHRFYVPSPLKKHSFWWALICGWAFISEWAFISANTVYCLFIYFIISEEKFIVLWMVNAADENSIGKYSYMHLKGLWCLLGPLQLVMSFLARRLYPRFFSYVLPPASGPESRKNRSGPLSVWTLDRRGGQWEKSPSQYRPLQRFPRTRTSRPVRTYQSLMPENWNKIIFKTKNQVLQLKRHALGIWFDVRLLTGIFTRLYIDMRKGEATLTAP